METMLERLKKHVKPMKGTELPEIDHDKIPEMAGFRNDSYDEAVKEKPGLKGSFDTFIGEVYPNHTWEEFEKEIAEANGRMRHHNAPIRFHAYLLEGKDGKRYFSGNIHRFGGKKFQRLIDGNWFEKPRKENVATPKPVIVVAGPTSPTRGIRTNALQIMLKALKSVLTPVDPHPDDFRNRPAESFKFTNYSPSGAIRLPSRHDAFHGHLMEGRTIEDVNRIVERAFGKLPPYEDGPTIGATVDKRETERQTMISIGLSTHNYPEVDDGHLEGIWNPTRIGPVQNKKEPSVARSGEKPIDRTPEYTKQEIRRPPSPVSLPERVPPSPVSPPQRAPPSADRDVIKRMLDAMKDVLQPTAMSQRAFESRQEPRLVGELSNQVEKGIRVRQNFEMSQFHGTPLKGISSEEVFEALKAQVDQLPTPAEILGREIHAHLLENRIKGRAVLGIRIITNHSKAFNPDELHRNWAGIVAEEETEEKQEIREKRPESKPPAVTGLLDVLAPPSPTRKPKNPPSPDGKGKFFDNKA